VANERNIDVEVMALAKASTLLRHILNAYTEQDVRQYPLWKYLKNKQSVYRPDGWSLIDRYYTNEEVVLFLEPKATSYDFFVFKNMQAVKEVLEHSFGFVFYLTDFKGDFLLCFNDHDYLIACGDAIAIINNV
jgi:hypothetical protein